MNYKFLFIGVLLVLALIESNCQNTVVVSPDIEMVKLDSGVYQHISYIQSDRWGRVGANGLLVRTEAGVIVIDTPWNNEQSNDLINWIRENWQQEVITIVVCHSHDDCAGGLMAFHQNGSESFGLKLTKQLLDEADLASPTHIFSDSLVLHMQNTDIELFYPGAAHSSDNIVVWLPSKKILFGGCAVKPISHRGLGNTSDADLEAWPRTIEVLLDRYVDARIVVPGHGVAGGINCLNHTLSLSLTHD